MHYVPSNVISVALQGNSTDIFFTKAISAALEDVL